MSGASVVELGQGRQMLDLHFRDHEGLIAAFLVPGEDGWTLLETGPTTCRPSLLAALPAAGVDPTEVRRVLVSHIHLDHAGGVGALARSLPRATFYVHERGVKHLVDPSRLIASARRAWGPAADPLWGEIVPVPADRLVSVVGGERIPVTGGDLEVLATPGHASHHVSFFDHPTRSMFTGDSAGVFVEGLARPRPAVPPPELDLDLLFSSLEKMAALDPRRLFFTHFGPGEDAVPLLHEYRRTVERWRDVALAAARTEPTVERVGRALRDLESQAMDSARPPTSTEDRSSLVSGYELAAQGFLRYFETHGLLSG